MNNDKNVTIRHDILGSSLTIAYNMGGDLSDEEFVET